MLLLLIFVTAEKLDLLIFIVGVGLHILLVLVEIFLLEELPLLVHLHGKLVAIIIVGLNFLFKRILIWRNFFFLKFSILVEPNLVGSLLVIRKHLLSV